MFKKLQEQIQVQKIREIDEKDLKSLREQEFQIESILEEISELIKGGKADGMTAEDIAKKHGVSVKEINKQIEIGIPIEHEHVNDKARAREISLDHLFEFPDYYTRLVKMEKEGEAALKETRIATVDGSPLDMRQAMDYIDPSGNLTDEGKLAVADGKISVIKEEFNAYLQSLREESMPENPEYGLPELKKFPLYDKKHVLAAIKFFNWVAPKDESKLAHAIIAKMKEHGLRKSNVGEDNRLKTYVLKTNLPE